MSWWSGRGWSQDSTQVCAGYRLYILNLSSCPWLLCIFSNTFFLWQRDSSHLPFSQYLPDLRVSRIPKGFLSSVLYLQAQFFLQYILSSTSDFFWLEHLRKILPTLLWLSIFTAPPPPLRSKERSYSFHLWVFPPSFLFSWCYFTYYKNAVHVCLHDKLLQSCLFLCDRWAVTRQTPLSMEFSRKNMEWLPALLQGMKMLRNIFSFFLGWFVLNEKTHRPLKWNNPRITWKNTFF